MKKVTSKYKEYPTTVGIEYALVAKNKNPEIDLEADLRLCNTAIEINKKYKKHKKWGKNIYNDCKCELGALELSSTPVNSLSSVISFYEYANSVFSYGESFSGYKFVANTTYKGIYIEGGGGHIHLGLPNDEAKNNEILRWNLSLFMLANPLIQWCMSEWCDDCILTSTYYNAFQNENKCKISQFSSELLIKFLDHYAGDWGRGPTQIRINEFSCLKPATNTIEFRCFAAPTSLQHMIDNIDICLSIWEFVKKQNLLYELYPLGSVKKIEEYSNMINVEKEWEILIKTLDLSYERYSKYLKNFYARKKHGILFSNKFAGI
jgi:hypothetical protein